MKNFLLTALMFLILSTIGSTASAAPKIELSLREDVGLYNEEIVNSLDERLRDKLSRHFDLSAEPEYKVEVFILSMGMGKLVNNGLATTISLGGSFASLFVSPLSGSSLGALGWVHATKPVFAVSVHVKVTRVSDGEVLHNVNRLGRSNIAKKDERPPRQVIEDAIEDAADTIARPLIKDSARSKPRIFR